MILAILLVPGVYASTLQPDCEACGCPYGEYCNEQTGLCELGCGQGIPADSCLSEKPKYCNNNAVIVDNCQQCGCPEGLECQSDGSCEQPPELYPQVFSTYSYNKAFDIMVETVGIPQGSTVDAQIIKQGGGLLIPTSFKWVSTTSVKFSFAPLTSPGTYEFQAYFVRSPYPTVFSEIFTFKIKAPLNVQFTVTDPNQYTVRDVELLLTVTSPTGSVIQVSRMLTGTINGIPMALHEYYVDLGSGSWKVIIPKEDLTEGIMDLKMTVTDLQGNYEKVEKTVTGITVTRPSVQVSIIAPETATCMDSGKITVGTSDIYSQPMDVEALKLTITYPNGLTVKTVTLDAQTNEFRKTGTGKYEATHQFTEGGAFQFHAVATKQGYSSGANSIDPITVVGSCGPGQSCDVSDQCDPNCPDDPDCLPAPELPLWIWLVVIGIIVFMVIGFIKVRKRK